MFLTKLYLTHNKADLLLQNFQLIQTVPSWPVPAGLSDFVLMSISIMASDIKEFLAVKFI